MAARILVVEDEESLAALLDYNLGREGFAVRVAGDGDEAMLAVEEESPDLVLLDWMLPGLSGIEVCRRIRAKPGLSDMPVIMLTARGEETDRIRGLDTGADDYLTKPFSARELLARVRSNLTRADGRRRWARALEDEARTLEALNRVGTAIAAELDLERAVQVVTDAATELTGAAFGSFFYNVIDERGESYTLYTLSGAPRAAFAGFTMPRNTAVFGPTFAGEGVVRVDDITKDPRYGQSAPYHGMPEGHLPVRSYLAAPVVSRSGEVLGGLFFGHPDTGVFTARAERLLTSIAAQAASAIDNARLYQAAQVEITERRQTEAALRESEARFRHMADSAPVMVWVTDPDGNCTYLGRPWSEFSGQAEGAGLGFGWLEVVHPDDRARTRETFLAAHARQAPFRLEYRLRRADGAWRWALDAAEPRFDEGGRFLGYVGSVLDITERKGAEDERERLVAALRGLTDTLEARVAERTAELAAANRELRAQIEERQRIAEELRQAQKMEIIGQLTGGVAHDFNNLLTIILGNLETLQRQLRRPAPEAARLQLSADNAVRGAERAAALTLRLLAFSRRQPLEPKALDVSKLVATMSDLLRRTLGERIAVETVPAGGLWNTHADPNQLESAILNLALNARDAMPDGGRLTIETANAELDESYAVRQAEVAPGQYVVIAVTDSGIGMSREVMGQAFEPFFTTKDAGHGTGLGLSQVYGFVKQSGGHVSIYSEPDQGTTVKVYLPRLHGAEAAEEPADHGAAGATDERSRTVLVVEDDDDVRAHSAAVLEELGYRVLAAPNGPAALEILERQPEVALLFTDVGLPGGMNGRQLAEEACRRRPGLRVLFTTGYARNAIVHDGRLDPGVQLITKPFSFAALAAKVRDLLEGDAGPPCVLVIEDEALVRMVTVDALEALGFRVEAAASATEAISKVRLLNGRIDAAVVDIGLPDRRGDALAAELRALDAGLPIVIASGYRDAELERRFAGDPALGFIGKPYDSDGLAAALAAVGIAPPGGR
jgi:PAS domain S-box-containing protein